MSGSLVPSHPSDVPASIDSAGGLQSWGPPAAPAATQPGGVNVSRYISALKRYKWLILGVVILGAAVGALATRFVRPEYQVEATVVIAEPPDPKGPIQAGQVLNEQAWRELIKSFAILDPVARQLRLYVVPGTARDSGLFAGFDHTTDLSAGLYTLAIDPQGRRYTLTRKSNGTSAVVERGAVGDSVGRTVGFLWHPPLAGMADRDIEFQIKTPRQVAGEIQGRLDVFLPVESRFLRLTLKGEQPRELATTMNAILRRFVEEAALLKKKNLTDVRLALEEQRDQANANYQARHSALEQYKIQIATQPTNAPVAVPGGVTITTNPALTSFMSMRVDHENARRDREALEALLARARADGQGLTPEAVLSLPQVVETSPNLKSAIDAVTEKQTVLRTLTERYTDQHPLVKDAQAELNRLQTQAIPSIVQQSLAQLRTRESELDRRINAASAEIRQIPQRTVHEQALQRDADLAYALFADIQTRYNNSRMAEASAIPDVSVLDSAQTPMRPSSNTAPALFGMIVGASLGLAILLALLLDMTDKRFRYPEQATNELGLDILATIPTIRRGRNAVVRVEDQAQLVEAFRGLRLGVRNAIGENGPVTLSVSSPGPGDGKSLVASNLALTFAEAGYKTLLIDGDIRRGLLHQTFAVSQRPGLVDHLSGDVALEDVIRETAHENLLIIPCGSRRHRGPELLASDGTADLIRSLRNRFDAIIVDTAPLGAGIDPYALGTATGYMILVLRTGQTDRKLASNKLATLDRMPVRVIGAVLNDVRAEGMYKYYSYIDGYGTLDEDEPPQIAAGDSRAMVSTRR
ncbi:MAG TPA: polysaccharide biosynthesis tyrosine autokinase [Gemmatimonadaceae bacterium]|nr:polysaccharide biosynthesis tyrosine autokinase [Gemmatimonadaceae bacterium]